MIIIVPALAPLPHVDVLPNSPPNNTIGQRPLIAGVHMANDIMTPPNPTL